MLEAIGEAKNLIDSMKNSAGKRSSGAYRGDGPGPLGHTWSVQPIDPVGGIAANQVVDGAMSLPV